MSDPIPPNIFKRIKEELERRKPCKVILNLPGSGKIQSATIESRETIEAQT